MPSYRSRKLKSNAVRPRDKIKPWRETELKEVRAALRKVKGDIFSAMILLGVSQGTIYRKPEKLGLRKGKRAEPDLIDLMAPLVDLRKTEVGP